MRNRSASRSTGAAGVLALTLLPMAGAIAGASLDEQLRLGVTVWRSACRASGLSPASVIAFTFELLPLAVAGALLGGLLVLAAALGEKSAGQAQRVLAAHAGCALTMPVGVFLCAMPMPLPFMLAADALLAGAVAWLVLCALASESPDTQKPATVTRCSECP